MSRMIWLSFPLDINDPRPPAIPQPTLNPLYTIDKDGASVQILQVASHIGTHVDTPRHVIPDGLSLDDFAPEDFIYKNPALIYLSLPPTVIVAPEHLEPHASRLMDCDIALFCFGYGALRKNHPHKFCTDCPGFGIEAAQWIVKNCQHLKAIGMDVPSLACIKHLDKTMASHNILLGGKNRKFLVIEDMDLSADLSKLMEVHIHPWRVRGMDSGPCSAVGILHS